MAQRRKLSTRGRVIAAGLSVGAAGVLAAAMAATDNTATASSSSNDDGSTFTVPDDRGSSVPASPYTDDRPSSSGSISAPADTPLPHTRSGGS